MARYKRFTFLCSVSERQAISDLALRLNRSQSDAVRFVIIEVARQLAGPDPAQVIGILPPGRGSDKRDGKGLKKWKSKATRQIP